MSLVRSGALRGLLLSACLAGLLLVSPAEAAKEASPRLSGLKAQVPKGDRVDLVASSLTAVELARLRPEFEQLKPRVRSNAE